MITRQHVAKKLARAIASDMNENLASLKMATEYAKKGPEAAANMIVLDMIGEGKAVFPRGRAVFNEILGTAKVLDARGVSGLGEDKDKSDDKSTTIVQKSSNVWDAVGSLIGGAALIGSTWYTNKTKLELAEKEREYAESEAARKAELEKQQLQAQIELAKAQAEMAKAGVEPTTGKPVAAGILPAGLPGWLIPVGIGAVILIIVLTSKKA